MGTTNFIFKSLGLEFTSPLDRKLNLSEHDESLRNPHASPFTRFGETEKFGYLVRQYFHTNLNERVNTRPFLVDIEKKWITYQLLKYLQKNALNGFAHGDLKCENIMVTSWNWVYVTDHAYPYKPVFLPQENNGTFSYYFDISQKRVCCLAPERFLPEDIYNKMEPHMLNHEDETKSNLHLMDVFAMGCVISELWTEGISLFDYPELLSYREGKFNPQNKIDKIGDVNIRHLILDMIQIDPKERITAQDCIHKFTENGTFPFYFESLYDYILSLMHTDPDDRVMNVYHDFETLKRMFHMKASKESESIKQLRESIQQMKLEDSQLEKESHITLEDDTSNKSTLTDGKIAQGYGTSIISNLSPTIYNAYPLQGTSPFHDIVEIEDTFLSHDEEGVKPNIEKQIDFEIQTLDKEMTEWDKKHNDLHNTMKKVYDEKMRSNPRYQTRLGFMEDQRSTKRVKPIEGFVIILDMLCAMLKHLKYPSSKLTCLDCFQKISLMVNDHVLLDRIIPFTVSLLDGEQSDPSSLVRAQAIRSLSNVLSIVENIHVHDLNLFQEYLLPTLNFVRENEKEEVVLEAYALSLPQLAESAKRFIEAAYLLNRHDGQDDMGEEFRVLDTHLGTLNTEESLPSMTVGPSSINIHSSNNIPSPSLSSPHPHLKSNYSTELKELRDSFRDIVASMLDVDAPLVVKKAVLSDISTLCRFFGQEYSEKTLLQLIFSCLNSRDWELRCAVFHNIVGLTSISGAQSIESFIFTCIPPQIYDESDFVMDGALNCLSALCQLGIFKKQRMFEVCEKASPLLLHSNIWIRYAVISILSHVAEHISIADVQSYLIPCIRKFLIRDISEVSQDTLIASLIPPISRTIFDRALNCTYKPEPMTDPSEETLMDMIQANPWFQEDKSQTVEETKPWTRFYEMDMPFIQVIAELELSAEDEYKLFLMKDYIKQASLQRARLLKTDEESNWKDEFMNLSKDKPLHHIRINSVGTSSQEASDVQDMDAEWKEMFESKRRAASKDTPNVKNVHDSPSKRYTLHDSLSRRDSLLDWTPIGKNDSLRRIDSFGSLPDPMNPYRPIHSLSQTILTTPTSHDASLLNTEILIRSPIDLGSPLRSSMKTIQTDWRPKGKLIGVLKEHQGAVHQLHVPQDSSFCASGSEDGTIKIWDCTMLDKAIVDRSSATFNVGSPITAMTFCDKSHSIAVATQNGSIRIIRVVERNKDRKAFDAQWIKSIDSIDGNVVHLDHIESFSQSLLMYAIDKGEIRSLDLRSDTSPWLLDCKLQHGYITSMVIDPDLNWVIVSTLRGYIICWDLRFNIPLYQIQLEGAYPIYKLALLPDSTNESKHSILISTGNGQLIQLDISEPKIERVIRTSDNQRSEYIPKFHDSNIANLYDPNFHMDHISTFMPTLDQRNIFRSIYSTSMARNAIFTAGTDKIIRCWDLSHPERSYIVSGPLKGFKRRIYQSIKEDISFIDEVSTPIKTQKDDLVISNYDPTTFHNDTILSLVSIDHPSRMMISSSRDGTLRVWK